MTDDVRVRAVEPVDLSQVAVIAGHYVRTSVATLDEEPPTREQWEITHQRTTARGLPFLVVADGVRLLGYAYTTPWRDKAAYRQSVESSIYLHPDATGRGLGTRLLGALLAALTDAGVRQTPAGRSRRPDAAPVTCDRR